MFLNQLVYLDIAILMGGGTSVCTHVSIRLNLRLSKYLQSDLCTQNVAAVPCDTTSNEVHICALCCKMYEYWMVVKFGLVRAIDNASGWELGGFQTANLNHGEYIHIGQILIWCQTRKQCLPMAIYTSIWQKQEMDSVLSSWKIICASSQLCTPDFWTIFRVIPSAGWSFQLFAQACSSN